MQKAQTNNSTYDFQDGNGPVPAHRHINGSGWVANTAKVENTAYIGPNARIFGYATIKDNVIVTEDAEVSAYAVIKDLACIKGKAIVRGSCTVTDHAEISGNVFIASNIKIGGYTLLNKSQCSFNTRGCMKCPALLNENYGSADNNQCLYCHEKYSEHKEALSDSRRSTVRSWLPEDRSINENIEAKTSRPKSAN